MVQLACGPCKPKWRRLVDNIFVRKAEASSTNKLTFFCIHKPDKLDRVSQYIQEYLDYYLYRKNYASALIAMDAIDSLLVACHAQRLNLFVINFLNMVQLMLETNDFDLMLRATKSFVEFSKIEEDTPNYHREYDTLLNHFTKVCYVTFDDPEKTYSVRKAGIQGVQGIVRKTTTDQLQMNILEADSINKIIPALLFNMRAAVVPEPCSANESIDLEENEVSVEATSVFEMISRWTSRSDMKPVLMAILDYMDAHKQWTHNKFPLFVFDRLCESSKATQSAHRVVKMLVEHLNTRRRAATPEERVGMVGVIGQVVISLAKDAVGPDVFHNFKSLLQILRASIESTSGVEQTPDTVTAIGDISITGETGNFNVNATSTHTSQSQSHSHTQDISAGEKQFQDSIVATIAEFAKNLPDTQKIEILKFILNFDPIIFDRNGVGRRSKLLTKVLLKTMLQLATQYITISISNVFNVDFLNLLLRDVAIDPDPVIRLFVQKIFHTLIDRHSNSDRLLRPDVYPKGTLKQKFSWEKPQRQDVMFMKKAGQMLLENLYQQTLNPSNKVNNLEHISCTISLLALELGAEETAEVVVELFRLLLRLQDAILDGSQPDDDADMCSPEVATPRGMGSNLAVTHRCAIHALIASQTSVLCQLVVPECEQLQDYIFQVIRAREAHAEYLLPSVAFNRSNTNNTYPTDLVIPDDMLFQQDVIAKCLSEAGHDVARLDLPFTAGYRDMCENASLNGDAPISVNNFSIDSAESTPYPVRRSDVLSEYNFESMRKVMTESADAQRQRRLEEEKRLIQYFKKADFDEICQRQKEKGQRSRSHLYRMLDTGTADVKKSSRHERISLIRRSSSTTTSNSDSDGEKATGYLESSLTVAPGAGPGPITPATKKGVELGQFGKKPLAVWEINYPSMFVS